MIPTETRNKLIQMVTKELDNAGIVFYENMTFPSMIEEEGYYSCSFSWPTASGASKLVLFPPNMDYIIKIPYNGFLMSFDDYEDNYYCENPVPPNEEESFDYDAKQEEIRELYYKECEVNPEKLLTPFRCALVRYDEYEDIGNWDYCYLESRIAKEAKKYGLEDIFIPTEWLFDYNGYPIYVQPKCEIEYNFVNDLQSSYNYSDAAKVISNEYCEDSLGYLEGTSWLASAFENYGAEIIDKLIEFLEDYRLCDLRSENRGLFNKKPVLIDYCGFNE